MAGLPRDSGDARDTVVTLARSLGVAASTVSRALRGDPRISTKTRRRVEALAAERGYAPNVLARTLASGHSGLIALSLGPISNPFYVELMQEAVIQAAARDLRLLLLHAGAGPIEDQTAQTLLQYQVDGCLITSAELSSHAARICAVHNVPVVMVNRVPKLHASAIACDNFLGGQDLARLLLGGGHQRFAIIRGNPDSSTSIERERGFAEMLKNHGSTSICVSMVARPMRAGSQPAACSQKCRETGNRMPSSPSPTSWQWVSSMPCVSEVFACLTISRSWGSMASRRARGRPTRSPACSNRLPRWCRVGWIY